LIVVEGGGAGGYSAARGIFLRSAVISLLLASVLAPILVGCSPAVSSRARAPERPRNVILMIADGTGPASTTMARDYVREVAGGDSLALDGILVGTVQTHSTDSRITDSAAGATAYATGVKTSNGSVGMDAEGRALGTLVEAAEAKGMATGIVVQSFLQDATPAAFMAHVPHRSMMNESAAQIVEQPVDVIFGGGRTHFVPAQQGGSRQDGRDLLQEWRDKGYQVVLSKEEFEGRLRVPVVGVFADEDMVLEIDRDDRAEPSLAAMARKAVDLLEGSREGFFLMVEGSNIDVAGHRNDAAAHLREMLAYDEAVAAMLDFARRNGNTLVISVADHETGGLTLGRSGASWNPAVLASIRASQTAVAEALAGRGNSAEVLEAYTGIDDLSDSEREQLQAAAVSGRRVASVVGDLVDRRAGVGWTTGNHTAVDVNLYAFGPGSHRFIGNHDNTHVGRTIAELLGLDLDSATRAARTQLAGP